MSKYTYVKVPASRGGGYDVFESGVWIGWSAGSRRDAQEMMGDTQKARP